MDKKDGNLLEGIRGKIELGRRTNRSKVGGFVKESTLVISLHDINLFEEK